MAIQLSYEGRSGILTIECSGTITLDDIQQVFAAILKGDSYPRNVPTLWDCRQVDFSTLDAGFAEQLIGLRGQHPERGRALSAIVVSDQLGFGLSRMYQMMSDGMPQQIMVFRDMEKAREWMLTHR